MKNYISKTFVILTLITLVACKKYTDEFYGPALGIAPDDFSASALTVSNDVPNFLSEKVYFESTFNATVRWKLTLTGGTSGAIKIIEGVSNQIDSTVATWDGSTDTLKVFRKDESVSAKLSVLGWDDTLSTTLSVGGEKYRGTVLGNFENISVNQLTQNFQDGSGLWWFFAFDAGEKDMVDKVADPDVPTGIHALKLVGHDVNSSYYIGQVGLSAPSNVFNFGTVTLDDFYFNIYVKGSGLGASNDKKFVMQTYENDNGGPLTYDGSEDKFTHTISLQYEGWKLHSVKYSDFILDPSSASNPYKSHSPDKIGNIGFFFGANTASALSPTAQITVLVDHFSITTNGPMIP